ncbi:MAG: hypothetical protein LBT53_09860 [Puniceicoccales bacterium]|jgi:tetratricopeptide (TPR) repeat protein|nr:hypothetical protein [Puniceicoccales bacterium]
MPPANTHAANRATATASAAATDATATPAATARHWRLAAVLAVFAAAAPAALFATAANAAPSSPSTTSTASTTSTPSTPPPAPALPDAESLRDEADALTLDGILRDQEALFTALKDDAELRRLPHAEKERRLTELSRRYEVLLSRRPDDAAIMVLYGKFLRLIDDRARANECFAMADRLMPNTAVIKHQLGVFAAEEGRYIAAHNLLGQAVTLEPATAIYHFHYGEFLTTYNAHLVRDNIFKTQAECSTRAQAAFRRAAELTPENKAFQWRYAESFFERDPPDYAGAFAEWGRIAAKAKTAPDREAAWLQQARALTGTGRFAEARRLLATSKTPELAASRKRLTDILDATEKAKK